MKSFFTTVFYDPLYNILVYLVDIIPGGNVGWAIIILTIIVRAILVPLYRKQAYTQKKMKEIQEDVKELQEKYKDDRQKLGEEMMLLYRENKVNPFSMIFILIIQIPIILSLFFIFSNGGLPEIMSDKLYSFVAEPNAITMIFFGIDMTTRTFIFPLTAAVAQYFVMKKAMPEIPQVKDQGDMKQEMAKAMAVQMKYGLPVIIFFTAFTLSSAVALYWTMSNLFTIFQDTYLVKK